MSSASPALASVLRSGRDVFNARVAEARRQHPAFDSEAFNAFVFAALDPLSTAVAQAAPERLTDTIVAGWDLALDLVVQKLVGPDARHPALTRGWTHVAPASAALIAQAPGRLLAALTNALHHLATTSGADPVHWCDTMQRLGPRCDSPDAWLRLGQLAAWRAGLAHFRTGALAAADALPPALVLKTLRASDDLDWSALRARLAADRWLDPSTLRADAATPAAPPRLAATPARWRPVRAVGAFRGLGGLFLTPPQIAPAPGEDFVVLADDARWLLTADAFGATFHRLPPPASGETAMPFPSRETTPPLSSLPPELAAYGEITSAALHERTMAVTCTHTHAVLLFTRPSAA